jgi:TonB family protein
MAETPVAVRELDFGQRGLQQDPAYRRAAARSWALAIGLHVGALLLLIAAYGTRPIQEGVASLHDSIGAFVLPGMQPAGTSGERPVEKKREAVAAKPSPDAGEEATDADAQGASGPSTDSLMGTGGPVRLVSGINVQLLKKIVPQYPRVMHSAGITGVVVLDAIIHRDGTIGDIKVLQSSAPAFTQAAIEAVQQWEYTPIPYEGVVTVTLTFNLNR